MGKYQTAREAIAILKPFKAGGRAFHRYGEWQYNFRGEYLGGIYRIYSYNTEIGQVDALNRTVYITSTKYSVTTSCHTSAIRQAVQTLLEQGYSIKEY